MICVARTVHQDWLSLYEEGHFPADQENQTEMEMITRIVAMVWEKKSRKVCARILVIRPPVLVFGQNSLFSGIPDIMELATR